MRTHAPPDLRVLGDRAGAVEERDVVLPRLPAAVRVGDAAAREHAREDLGARGVQAGVDVLDERRARREREQLGQEVAQRVVHRDRAVGAGDADVHVQAERVVAPDDVAEELVVPAVVRRVDDALVLPAAPRVRAGRAERELLLAGERVELRAPLLHRRGRLAESSVQRPVRTSTSEAISSPTTCSASSVCSAAAFSSSKRFVELERLGVEERELLLDRDA